jgi:hypothetical protein
MQPAYTGGALHFETSCHLKRALAMGIRSRIFWSAVIASIAALGGCNNSVMLPPVYLSVAITPRLSAVPAGTTVVFAGAVSNNLSIPQWSILDAALASNAGTLTPISGSPNSILYTAPATPPIYSQTPTGITQGTVTVNVTVADPPGTSIPITPDSVSFVITAPAITMGLSPATANVALGATSQFFGYAVGNLNNAITWQINGVIGGSTATGTINSAGTYTAPMNLPMNGNTVTITVVSQADPNKTASAIVTLH